MALTRDFRETMMKHMQEDAAFRSAMIQEAARNLMDGEVEIALDQLRDIVNATMGFDTLASETGIPKTSLMRMLGTNGNPRAANLAAILKAVGSRAGVKIEVHVEPLAACV